MLYFFIVIQNEKVFFSVKSLVVIPRPALHEAFVLRELLPLSVPKYWDINVNLNLFCAKLP